MLIKYAGPPRALLAVLHGQKADSLHLYCEDLLLLKPRMEERIGNEDGPAAHPAL